MNCDSCSDGEIDFRERSFVAPQAPDTGMLLHCSKGCSSESEVKGFVLLSHIYFLIPFSFLMSSQNQWSFQHHSIINAAPLLSDAFV